MWQTQARRPASLRRSVCHQCVRYPVCTDRSIQVIQPLVGPMQAAALNVHPHGTRAFGHAKRGTAEARPLGQRRTDTPVQQFERLAGGRVDWHAARDEKVPRLLELDGQVPDSGAHVDRRWPLVIDRIFQIVMRAFRCA